jgi:hypothetical protein
MNIVALKPANRHVMWKVKGRKRNRDYRTREHLTQDELDRPTVIVTTWSRW